MNKLSIGDIVSRAWDLSVKHWPVFILLSIVEAVLGSFINGNPAAFAALGPNPDPQEVVEALNASFNPLMMLVVILGTTYLNIIVYRMLVSVLRTGQPYADGQLADALKVNLVKYGFFLGVNIVMGLAVGFASLLCIIPGIFLSVRWWFTPLIAATEDVTFGEAFGLSWEMTKGHFWELFLLGIVCVGIAIVGFCACCVGIIFAEVIINFIVVLAYEQLSRDAETEVTKF
ncbi:MAG: glycerophosphoryl diester phosphodiesterase membrane domain-containing protein [Bacteroidaceae bacterium]|nr:glycerophosphoryl diester phosphodiesterase membrane domain-containing protein [Bacteroidaceae bacterium]